MSMIVKNNMGAQRTLNTLNKNSKKLEKAFSKVASGMKIVGAGDGASEYAISEKMREQIRSLDQDSQNVQNGQSLFKIAAGGIENIVEELRTLKELAIKSANDTNNDGDRLTIQKEFTQRMATINDIATETNYNGKALLSGDYAKIVIVGQDIQEHSKIIGYQTRTIKIKKPSYTRILVPIGVTDIKENNTNSNLTKNFKAIASGMTTLDSPTSMRGMQCDIGFKGGNWNWANAMRAKTPGVNFTVSPNPNNQIGVSMDFTFGKPNPTIQDLDGEGFNIQCGEKNYSGCNQYINIVFDASIANADSTFSRSPTDIANVTYTIGISDLSAVDNDTLSEAIFNGVSQSGHSSRYGGAGYSSRDIYVNGDVVSTLLDETHDVRVALNPNYDASDSSKGTKYIFLKGGNILAMDFLGSGTIVGSDKATPQDIQYKEVTVTLDVDSNIELNEPIMEYYHVEEDIWGAEGKPLVIHHGPRANLNNHYYINNMHTKFLGAGELYIDDATLDADEKIVNQNDLNRYHALSYDRGLQEEWLETLKLANKKSLDDLDVVTKRNANIAIRVIDGAIEYALNEATNIGAYLQGLDYTGANITTMNENVQSAESTIRDADMAKEMTEYTKFNVLLQASQSILAQANQNLSQVLSLPQ